MKITTMCSVIMILSLGGNKAFSAATTDTFFFSHDSQGSITSISDDKNEVVLQQSWSPWGQRLDNASQSTLSRFTQGQPIRQGYTGHKQLLDANLVLAGDTRLYDPKLKRFYNTDDRITGGVRGNNRFVYAYNNPLAYVDPDGHAPVRGQEGVPSDSFDLAPLHETLPSPEAQIATLDNGERPSLSRSPESMTNELINWVGQYYPYQRGYPDQKNNKYVSRRQSGVNGMPAFKFLFTPSDVGVSSAYISFYYRDNDADDAPFASDVFFADILAAVQSERFARYSTDSSRWFPRHITFGGVENEPVVDFFSNLSMQSPLRSRSMSRIILTPADPEFYTLLTLPGGSLSKSLAYYVGRVNNFISPGKHYYISEVSANYCHSNTDEFNLSFVLDWVDNDDGVVACLPGLKLNR